MEHSEEYKFQKKAEEKIYSAGGGPWYHKETGEEIIVRAALYPNVKLYIGETQISKAELEKNYKRLEL